MLKLVLCLDQKILSPSIPEGPFYRKTGGANFGVKISNN
jgi:hypothetical protein